MHFTHKNGLAEGTDEIRDLATITALAAYPIQFAK
jgi:hypothetical protein